MAEFFPIEENRVDLAEWPISWGAVWVGALAALAVALLFGLSSAALGVHVMAPGYRILKWNSFSVGALVFAVCGAFFSFVVGGWGAGRIAGARRVETAILHGVIAWLVALPILLVLMALGAGSLFGGWYAGLGATPMWILPRSFPEIDPNAVIALRNAALGACTALLLGLLGAVLGGWLASGEPMRFSRHEQNTRRARTRKEGLA
jgi:hypothetical protein